MATFRIVICGEGGQGVLSIAKTIAYSAWQQGKEAVYVPYFSTEKRGGVSMAFAQIGDEPIPYPRFQKADLWVVMSQRAISRSFEYLDEGSVVVANGTMVTDLSTIAKWNPHVVDAGNIAKTKLKKPRTFNMIVMGAMLRHIPMLDKDKFGEAIDKTFKSKYEKDPSLKALNRKAFDIGYESGAVIPAKAGIQKNPPDGFPPSRE